MNRKKVYTISVFLILTLDCNRAYAHNGDYYSGEYNSTAICNQSNLHLYIESNAQNSLLNSSVYNSGTSWNSITSHVNVSIAYYAPGFSSSGFYSVLGSPMSTGIRGVTTPYDTNGNVTNFDNNWQRINIVMNTNVTAYNGSTSGYSPSDQAKKTFIHEIGHALKLKHPSMQFGLSGHTYPDGRPCALMNEGLINGTYIPAIIKDHDKNNLITKWG